MATLMIPINEARVIFSRMFEFVDTPENLEEKKTCKESEEIDANSISLDSLSFHFIGRKNLLDGISLEFNRGTITSIVGECGCGKSTLCQILERFYNPDKGRLLLNGKDASVIPLEQWSKMIAFVPQDIFLCNGTLLDNICFGEAVKSVDEVTSFCEKYGFDRFFKELPDGIFTIVGEGGIKLSGGQKQLVAFARALYRPHSIFILDEMTAAMDRKTENVINDLLVKLKEDHIIICVTHRLDTARLISDQIVLLENSTVAAMGNHHELMNTDNYYSQYWRGLSNMI
jgi:ATP-binding cassette, subfamily C, bacteriocin exporter